MAKSNFREQKQKGWSGKHKDHRHVKSWEDGKKDGKGGKRVPVSVGQKHPKKITPNNWRDFVDTYEE